MKCLLVIAHPGRHSLNAALAETAAAALRENGHEVHVRDLYEATN
jgi:NAD(P)H dehydrogenase (quinone)